MTTTIGTEFDPFALARQGELPAPDGERLQTDGKSRPESHDPIFTLIDEARRLEIIHGDASEHADNAFHALPEAEWRALLSIPDVDRPAPFGQLYAVAKSTFEEACAAENLVRDTKATTLRGW